MAKSFKIATNEFINKTLGGKLKTADKTLKDPLKCPTYDELKKGVNFVYTDGTTLGIQWRGTVNGEDYTGEYDSDRCLAEIDIEKLNSHDFKIYTNSGHTNTSMSADCMTTAEDISGKTRYEADRLNENFIYPVYSQSGDVKWHEYDDSDENVKQKTVTVNLSQHGSWATYSKNPDSTLYNAYMSTTNADNGYDVMTISLSTGFTEFTIYIRSYAVSSYDYTIAGKMDTDIPISNIGYNDSRVNTTTRDHQIGGTDIDSYTKVEYTNIDSSKEHTIWVMYSKYGGSNYGDDRGYVLIPKSQNNDYIIIGDLNVASITHSGAVPTSSCTFTYKNEQGNVDTIKERWDASSKKYTLTGIYKGLTANTVNITQSGETYGYYADSAHTQWVSANALCDNGVWNDDGNYSTNLSDGSPLDTFYTNLRKQNGWLNDFGDNSGTTNGRDEYNIDTTNYSSGKTLTWEGSTEGNVYNAQDYFNSSYMMGETISSAKTNTYHMAFSNDMWYSGTTLPTTTDNKHDFYWIFLDENAEIEHSFWCGESGPGSDLVGIEDTTNYNYKVTYTRSYFKPLHCYGKTSIDRMYKYGTNEYDKGTTTMRWLQGSYPKHFKRAVLRTQIQINPYSNSYNTEINKLGLNEHIVMLDDTSNSSQYDASKLVKASKDSDWLYSDWFPTFASTNDKGYHFKPRFIMMSPERYSADTEGKYDRIISGQQLSYNEHTSGDSYDWSIKADTDTAIYKLSSKSSYISYNNAWPFEGGTECYSLWPKETYYFPTIYELEYGKVVERNGVRYACTGYTKISDFDGFVGFVTDKSDIWSMLAHNPGYGGTPGTINFQSNAVSMVTTSATNVSFTYVNTIHEKDFDYDAVSVSSYTYTVSGSIDCSPGTTLKINYSGGTSVETDIVDSTGYTINVSNEIDTTKIITSVDYTVMLYYEWAVGDGGDDVNHVEINTGFARFKGISYKASEPTAYKIITINNREETQIAGDSNTGEILLGYKEDGSVGRTLTVLLQNSPVYTITYGIVASSNYNYLTYKDFLKSMASYDVMVSMNRKSNYWISDAWDDSKKYKDFS